MYADVIDSAHYHLHGAQSTADNADQRGPKKHPARARVVERTRHNRFRRLGPMGEKKYPAHVASVSFFNSSRLT